MINKPIIYVLLIGAVLVIGYWLLSGQVVKTSPTTLEQPHALISQPAQQANSSTAQVCNGQPTASLTEGPYYKNGSPKRTNIVDPGVPGEKITIKGLVLDSDCLPIENAWLDFWQTDGEGVYDNQGFKLRGHQYTNEIGEYILETVIPGEYPGRTPHIHVKVRAGENSQVVTSQLFLPTDRNDSDSIFDPSLVVIMSDDRKTANFNFVVPR